MTFVSAATTDTGQAEFYRSDRRSAMVSLSFLHEYVLGNYRDLYAATLALQINDHNAALIVENLLSAGQLSEREGSLIAARLAALPPQRVYRLLARLCRAGRNNRRFRAIARDFLAGRDLAFDAVKYRRHLRVLVRHAHLTVPKEVALVLTGEWRSKAKTSRIVRGRAGVPGWRGSSFTTPLLETWRRAHYDRSALFELPFTVAEGLATSRGVSRELLLERGRLTRGEQLRLHTAARHDGIDMTVGQNRVALSRMPLDRLAAFIISLDVEERIRRRDELEGALRKAALTAVGPAARSWGTVAAVLDDSWSSSGSTAKRQRPLSVAFATHYLVEALAEEYVPVWTSGRDDGFLASPVGATDLAHPVLNALEQKPQRLIVVSDAVDTSPPGAIVEVMRIWGDHIDDGATKVVHLNPVFDPERYEVRRIAPVGSVVASIGIRDARNVPLLVELARFATGEASHPDLIELLNEAVIAYLANRNSHHESR